MTSALTQEQEAEADRLAGEHATLRDRAVPALRAEMSVLSSQYFDLTGEVLK